MENGDNLVSTVTSEMIDSMKKLHGISALDEAYSLMLKEIYNYLKQEYGFTQYEKFIISENTLFDNRFELIFDESISGR